MGRLCAVPAARGARLLCGGVDKGARVGLRLSGPCQGGRVHVLQRAQAAFEGTSAACMASNTLRPSLCLQRLFYICARDPMWAPLVRWSARVADLELVALRGAHVRCGWGRRSGWGERSPKASVGWAERRCPACVVGAHVRCAQGRTRPWQQLRGDAERRGAVPKQTARRCLQLPWPGHPCAGQRARQSANSRSLHLPGPLPRSLVAQQPLRRRVVRSSTALPRALADVLKAPRPPFTFLTGEIRGPSTCCWLSICLS